MDLKKLKYSKEWLEYEFISKEELNNQNLALENGEDKNTEHFRYKSFSDWVNNNNQFTDAQIQQFIHLIELDEDQTMAGAVVADLFTSLKLSEKQREIVRAKLISFGAWAVKFVEKQETKYKESFNEKFCTFLEGHLCDTFSKSDDKSIRRLWCDGIDCDHFSRKQVNDTRRIKTTAWIGEEGHVLYELTIEFGKYALRRYARRTEMIDCIPSSDTMDWIDLDIGKKRITVFLR